jgi:hypothetical protein
MSSIKMKKNVLEGAICYNIPVLVFEILTESNSKLWLKQGVIMIGE